VSARRGSFNLFDIWGFTPVLGRGFTATEDRPGGEAVVVLSQGFWSRQFGSDPTAVGSVLELDGEPHTVVGVLGPEVEIGGGAVRSTSGHRWRSMSLRPIEAIGR